MQVKEDSVSRQSVKVDSATGGIIFPLPWTSYELMQARREFYLSEISTDFHVFACYYCTKYSGTNSVSVVLGSMVRGC